jgi:glycosyltransferase involved in cell wall biosynthesis
VVTGRALIGPGMTRVALVHDYLTQRGGAERVVLALAAAYPEAPLHTSLYEPGATFPGFAALDVRPSALNRVAALRHDHRLALPVLAPTFSALHVDADVVLCSSSGWAHGARASGRKVVYCHSPARWLYQSGPYLAGLPGAAGAALRVLGPALRSWDRRAAATADRYLVNSFAVQRRVQDLYRIDAEGVPPPVTFDPDGPVTPVDGIEDGFFLCVSRLLSYKNIAAVIEAFSDLAGQRLVVVGTGPLAAGLAASLPRNVTLLGRADDARLRWLYRSCAGVVAASYEDFGLTPIEGAAFGKPAAVLRWGGFLDTTVEGETGVFFDQPTPEGIITAVREMVRTKWSATRLLEHAELFSLGRFTARLAAIIDLEAQSGRTSPSLQVPLRAA